MDVQAAFAQPRASTSTGIASLPFLNAASPGPLLLSPSPSSSSLSPNLSSSSFSSTTLPWTASSSSVKTDCSVISSVAEHDGDQFAVYQAEWPPSVPTLHSLSKAFFSSNALDPASVVAADVDEYTAEQRLCMDADDIGLVLSAQEDTQSSSRRRLIESRTFGPGDASSFSGPFAHHRSPSWVAGAHYEGRVRARSSTAVDSIHSKPQPSQTPLSHTLQKNARIFLATGNEIEAEIPYRTSSTSTTATTATKTKSASRDSPRAGGASPKARQHTGASVSSTLSFHSKHRIEETEHGSGGNLPIGFPHAIMASTCTSFGPLSSNSSRSSIALDDAFWLDDDRSQGVVADTGANDVSLAVSTAEEGVDVRVEARDVQLEDIEHSLSARTTHLILSGSRSVSTLAFLERALPIVAPSLLVLDVSSTGLQEFPEALAQCRRLEELNMSNNPLVQAPAGNVDVLAMLSSSLRVLMIDDCGLTMLPIVLIELKQLRLLSLCHNHLVHLPAWLHRLHHLQSLLLVGNPFQGAWKIVCQPFCLDTTAPIRRNTLESSESSASSSGYESSINRYSSATSEEDVEEMMDPAMNAVVEGVEKLSSGRSRSLRPLVRRMMSGNDLKGAMAVGEEQRNAAKKGGGTRIDAESKWSTIKRRLTKRSSDPVIDQECMILPSRQGQSNSAKTRSNLSLREMSAEWQHNETSALNGLPLAPRLLLADANADDTQRAPRADSIRSSAHSPLRGDSSEATAVLKKEKRASFLPFGTQREAAASEETATAGLLRDRIHCGHVRSLMSYLADLSELNFDQQQYLDKLHGRLSLPSKAGVAVYGSHRGSINSLIAMDDAELACLLINEGQRDPSESIIMGAASAAASSNGKESGPAASTYKDSAHRRAHIISEIVSTEETYVNGLQELIDIYVRPSSERDATQQPVVEPTERRRVFGNIESILHFHTDAFLPALRAAAAPVLDRPGLFRPTMDGPTTSAARDADEEDLHALTARAAEQLARTFERHAAFFRMYSSYVNNVDLAQTRVAEWKAQCLPSQSSARGGNGVRRDSNAAVLEKHAAALAPSAALSPKERKRIRSFMQLARASPRHSQLSLEAYLHLPVQRIPRYRLLFEDLERTCPPERLAEKHSVLNALASITSVANMMNESKRQSEMGQRLLQWQERIHGVFPSPLVQPHRKLIHDGALTLRRIVSREPSFCVTRAAILGDTTMYDHNEEPSLLLVADAIRPPSSERDTAGIVAVDDDVLQVCYLKQQNVAQELQVILCNDIIVIVEGSRDGNVKLFAALRVAGPARIVNNNTLRIVGHSHILYLTTPSAHEALAWRQALDTAQAPSTPAPPA